SAGARLLPRAFLLAAGELGDPRGDGVALDLQRQSIRPRERGAEPIRAGPLPVDRKLGPGAHRGDPERRAHDPGRRRGPLLRGDGVAPSGALRGGGPRRRELVLEVAPYHGAAFAADNAL